MPESNSREHSGKADESTLLKRALVHALAVLVGYTLLFVVFFAPVLFSGYLLAPGDGILYFLPNFYARRVWWDASVWGGFPAVGDSQLMLWYPPAILFALVKSWNAFLLSAYVLAASFTYAYVYALTRSRFAATVGGICYGMSGFIIAHLGHAALVHAAAWLPLFILSLERLAARSVVEQPRLDELRSVEELRGVDEARSVEELCGVDEARSVNEARAKFSRFWFAVGTLTVACCALAGHPQIFVYMLLLGGAYALVRGWQINGRARWLYYFLCALSVLTGTGIACVQLVPTAELAALSLRASLGFAEFVSYSLPPRQTPMLVFPYLYGGSPGTLYNLPYFGAWGSEAGGWGAGELSGYVGLLPLMLAALGFVTARRRRASLAWFWLAACAVAFLLALGDATPLARLTYRLPVINKFRVPARHFMELALGISVLAGFGAHAVLEKLASRRLLRLTLIVASSLLLASLLAIVALTQHLNALAAATFERPLSFLPWANPATGIPLLVFVAGAASLLYWHRKPHSRARRALLLSVLVLDLASFTWFYEWHYGPPYKVFQQPPRAAVPLRDELTTTHQRLLPVRGGTGRVSEIPPNLSKLWQFPSASGYGPFILSRVSRMLTMPPHGSVSDAWRDPANLGLDLMSVRYLFVPRARVEPPATTDERGVLWTQGEFNVQLGSGCAAPNPTTFKYALPRSARADSIAVASALACSVALPDQAEVARVVVRDTRGQTYTQKLLAGRDTSEWAFDCADVRPTLRQTRAPVYRSYPVTRPGDVQCEGHDYVTRLPLPASVEVAEIEIQWTGEAGTLALKKISLIETSGGGSVPLVPITGSLSDATRWRHVADINPSNSNYGAIKPEDVGEASVYENLRARPRAWLVGKVLQVTEDEALHTLHSSRLPDGSAFDPAQVALVETPLDFPPQTLDASHTTARITHLSDERMEVVTGTSTPAFLVTSDVFYPGWQATIDGAHAEIFQTNYALRGVLVPAGTHTVRFTFRPLALHQGASISIASLIVLCAAVFWLKRKDAPEGDYSQTR
jgi:hypothetical protein